MYNLKPIKAYQAHFIPKNGSPNGSVNYISINPNNEYFATCGDDRTVRIWALDGYKNKAAAELICTFPEQEDIINIVTFSEDCKFLATANWSGFIKIYKTKDNWNAFDEIFSKVVYNNVNGEKYPIKELYFNNKNNKNYLLFKVNQKIQAFEANNYWKNIKKISNSYVNKLEIIKPQLAKTVLNYLVNQEHAYSTICSVFSRDKKFLVSADFRGYVIIWKNSYFIEISVDSLEEIYNLKKVLNNSGHTWIFRGQNCNKEPKTSLERYFPSKSRKDAENRILDSFKSRAAHYIPNPNELPQVNIGWTASIQHYGGNTRLLDFSENFYTALYFAIKDPLQIDKENPLAYAKCDQPVIWCINCKELKSNDKTENKLENLISPVSGDRSKFISSEENEKQECGIYLHNPKRKNNRMYHQDGLFLVPQNIEVSFWENLTYYFVNTELKFDEVAPFKIEKNELKSEVLDQCNIVKLSINLNIKKEIFNDLNTMKFNEEILFPGLDGLARLCSYRHYFSNKIIEIKEEVRKSNKLIMRPEFREIDNIIDPFIKIETLINLRYTTDINPEELHAKIYEVIDNLQDDYLKLGIYIQIGNSLRLIGNKDKRIDLLNEALTYIDKAISITEEDENSMNFAYCLNSKGVIYKLIGKKSSKQKVIIENFKNALDFYQKAEKAAQKTINARQNDSFYQEFYLLNLKNQAIAYVDMGKIGTKTNRQKNLSEANKLYKKLINTLPDTLGKESFHSGDLYKNYADFLVQKEDFKNADNFAEKAEKIYIKDPTSIGYFETKKLIQEIKENLAL